LTEPVDFIFDRHANVSDVKEGWRYMKLSATPDVRRLMGNEPVERDDVDTMPLQAADLYAWWVRHWIVNGITDGVQHLRFPWKARDIPRLHMEFLKEEDFTKTFEKSRDAKTLLLASLAPDDASRVLREIERRESENGKKQ
jgi:hypothetical protein